jgi:hypothetical protein
MRKLRLLASFALIISMFTLVSGVSAQSYSFNLTQETVQATWDSNGTLALDYTFTFANDPSGHVIDYVDVGMPNGNFNLGNASADANGHTLSVTSDFQGDGSYGFAVDMGSQAIQPGAVGSVHVSISGIDGTLYPGTDSNKPDYASTQFWPAYFTTAHGITNMTVIFILPQGVQPSESVYYPASGGWPCDANPQTDLDPQGRVRFTWACANADGGTQYKFGASFPNKYVPAGVIVTAPAFDIGGFISGIASNASGFCCFGFFLLMFVGAPILSAVNQNKRKLQYLPPKIQIEGHGIKRGLTAVEAAILMEQPLDKVMTMILFGVVKKNAAVVLVKDPLKLQLASPQPDGLHEYEKDFMAAFADENLAARRKSLQEMTVRLVNSISDKMKGFSRKETLAYYQSIMQQAWKQIETAGTPEVKSQMYDQSLEWTMLDKDYDEHTRRVFTGPIFVPMWWGNYDPAFRPAAASGGAGHAVSVPAPTGGRSTVTVPGAAMAASVVNSVQGFSSRVIGDVKSFTSGVTNRTNPVPVTKSGGWSGGGGGGHSCACACACAGCACACAGGGR